MIARPVSEWLYTGFKFQGPGWYPKYRALVEETGALRDGKMTYRLLHYDADPRPSLAAAAQLPTVGE